LWEEEFRDSKGFRDLSYAELSGGLFCCQKDWDAPLRYANFHEAQLDGTIWFQVHLKNVNFSGASLRESWIDAMSLEGSAFRGADLSGAHLTLYFFKEDESPIDFSNATLSGTTIEVGVSALYNSGPTRTKSPRLPIVLTGAQMNGCRVGADNAHGHSREGQKQILEMFVSCLSEEQRSQIVLQAPSRCFIASAACGTDQAEDVVRLRACRDHVLRNTGFGRRFIEVYETTSPPLARLIARSALARTIVRSAIVRPSRRVADSLLDFKRRRNQQ
jgi:hypothetical protein